MKFYNNYTQTAPQFLHLLGLIVATWEINIIRNMTDRWLIDIKIQPGSPRVKFTKLTLFTQNNCVNGIWYSYIKI